MSSSLAPTLLLSMPQLLDPNFNRTVVLLCKHNEDGAFGLVVNRPLVTTGRVMVSLEPSLASERRSAEPLEPFEQLSTDRELQVWVGGPVEPQRSWILASDAPPEPATDAEPGKNLRDLGTRIADGLYLSTSPDLLRRLLGPSPPARARLIVGYSGWAPGQLEAELEASAWLMSDVNRDLLFNTAPDLMWETAIRRLGADPYSLQMSRGVH
jgi:putative transcriptional regulator